MGWGASGGHGGRQEVTERLSESFRGAKWLHFQNSDLFFPEFGFRNVKNSGAPLGEEWHFSSLILFISFVVLEQTPFFLVWSCL